MTSMASDDIVQQMVAGYDMGAFESSSEELGSELNTNPTFSNFTGDVPDGWTVVGDDDAGNNISQGSAGGLRIQSDGSAIYAQLADVTTSDKIYKYSITLANLTDDDFNFNNGGTTFFTANGKSEGTYTGHFQAVSTFIRIIRLGSCDGEVTAFSIKEVLQSDLSDTYPAIIDVNEPVAGTEILNNFDFSAGTGSNATNWSAESTSVWVFDEDNDRYMWDKSSAGAGDYMIKQSGANMLIANALDIGKVYQLTINITAGSNSTVTLYVSGDSSGNRLLNATALVDGDNTFTVGYPITGSGADNDAIEVYSDVSENSYDFWLNSVSLKEVQGNTGFMTNQDSADLVYSSVLPDQSFLTGVNSAYNFLDFDGVDAYVEVEQTFTSDNFALSFWINPDNVTGDKYLFDQNAGICRSVVIGYQDGYINFINDDNDAGNYYPTGTASDTQIPVSIGEWQHYVMMTDGTKVYGYKNGAEIVNVTGKWGASGAEKLWIGQYESGNNYEGKITAVGVWNKTLSSPEISAIYTAGKHTNLLDSYSDNLKGYYAFGALDATSGLADTDSTIYDRSGNSNHGTTSGTATGDLKSSPNAEPNGYSKGDTNRSTTTP
jgi:hypothetical protein